jgi:hypothetical protein
MPFSCYGWDDVSPTNPSLSSALVVESRVTMNKHYYADRISRLSEALDELLSKVSARGGSDSLPQELADEIAATAGEVMVELADQRGSDQVRGVLEAARRLRDVVRTVSPPANTVAEAGRVLGRDLELFIRDDKLAA